MSRRELALRSLTLAACFTIVALAPRAQEAQPDPKSLEKAFGPPSYSPYAERKFPSQVFWGDTHLHTAISFDAGAFGNRLLPEDAYRFAKGEEVTSSTGTRVKLSRPLDFLVVADHSDNMGLFTRIFEGDREILADPFGRRIYDMIQAGGDQAVTAAIELIDGFSKGTLPPAMVSLPGSRAFKSTWELLVQSAEAANTPGQFTAFIGYEWTSNTNGNNLHRVVMFRDDANRALLVQPFTTVAPLGSDDPRALWAWMEGYEERTGGDVLAIAHNGNLSNGIMFPRIDSFTGRPLDLAYVKARAKWEPLYEITQIKGDGETHSFLSPNDEFADYETWDTGNLNLSVPKTKDMLQYEYARSALKLGLELENSLGTNPYKFGVIGSTDSHTSLATAQEDNFFGKHSGCEPNAHRPEHIVAKFGDLALIGWQMASSGLCAVWARDNSRRAIFDAMENREVYATTGSRMAVRFFGGWEFAAEDAHSRSPAFEGYGKGVPMGSDLSKRPDGASPSFLVYALRDPIGANLDRIQIVKGWLDAGGKTAEKVYDVVWAGDRVPGSDGVLPPVGDTVDVARATWTNTIGASELITTWIDPDFDPSQRAFYYARVIEVPTPRWTAYDAARYGVKLPAKIPMKTQERAYTSPIWYTPAQ